VSAVSGLAVWASGSKGTFLRTVDGGVTWQAAVVPEASELDFRSVRALDNRTAWLMSSGPGAQSRIYKTSDSGTHWSLLYTNPDATGFLDGLAFWDEQHGIALGDPVGGQFVVLTTADAGKTWQRRKLPPALPNEGAFAASNSCLFVRGERDVWFGTGGAAEARVFQSGDGGQNWEVISTPLRHDGAGAGIFSLAFSDAHHGVAVGGDYSKSKDAAANFAFTTDGGRKWLAPESGRPGGFRSAAVFLPKHKIWIAVGTSGSDVSEDGKSWKTLASGSYNALAAATDDSVWAVGDGGRVGRLDLK